MKPNSKFLSQPPNFWAHVRIISQKCGYTVRGKNRIKVPTPTEIENALRKLDLKYLHVIDAHGNPTEFGKEIIEYFQHRAKLLNTVAESNLMRLEQAKSLFHKLKSQLSPACPLPMNKQRGEKKGPAYFTGIINMLIEANASGMPCDYDPRFLTTVTIDSIPVRTFSRRLDGAFPAALNPVAIWEIKEYYHTTSFGSRVADAVYETQLDGFEAEELLEQEGRKISHYLFVDAYDTWWLKGRSYLCRICDLLHMGYLDEVLFGYEVVDRLPKLVKEWVKVARKISR